LKGEPAPKVREINLADRSTTTPRYVLQQAAGISDVGQHRACRQATLISEVALEVGERFFQGRR